MEQKLSKDPKLWGSPVSWICEQFIFFPSPPFLYFHRHPYCFVFFPISSSLTFIYWYCLTVFSLSPLSLPPCPSFLFPFSLIHTHKHSFVPLSLHHSTYRNQSLTSRSSFHPYSVTLQARGSYPWTNNYTSAAAGVPILQIGGQIRANMNKAANDSTSLFRPHTAKRWARDTGQAKWNPSLVNFLLQLMEKTFFLSGCALKGRILSDAGGHHSHPKRPEGTKVALREKKWWDAKRRPLLQKFHNSSLWRQ